MPELYINPLERPDLAVANALSGNLSGSVRSLFSPDSLSPEERQTLHEKWFGPVDPGPVGEILKYTTNPTVIAAAIWTLRNPIAMSASDIPTHRRTTAYLEGKMRTLLPLYDHIASFNELFEGTPLPDIVLELSQRRFQMSHEGKEILAKSIRGYEQLAGTAVDIPSMDRIVTALGNHSDPNNPMWDALRDAYKDSPDDLSRINRAIKQLPNNAVTMNSLNAAERQLANGIREFLDYSHEKAGPDAEGIREALGRKVASKKGPGVTGQYLENYWPHLAHKTPEEARRDISKIVNEILEGGEDLQRLKIWGSGDTSMTVSEFGKMRDFLIENYPEASLSELKGLEENYLKDFAKLKKGTNTPGGKVASMNNLMRFNRMVPNADYLRRMGGPYEELASFVENAKVPDPYKRGKLVPIPQFRGDFKVLESYLHDKSRDYAFSVIPEGGRKSLGARLYEVAHDVGKQDPMRKRMLRDVYLQGILYDTSYEEMVRATWMHNMRSKSVEVLESAAAQKFLPKSFRERAITALKDVPPLGSSKVASDLTSLMYASTLALPNVVSPIKNLAQTIITTYPTIGLRDTLHGVKEAFSRYFKFTEMMFEGGVSYEEAAKKAFGSFHATPFDYDEGMRNLLSSIEDPLRKATKGSTQWRKLVQNGKTAMMSAFLTTERLNRMIAFYGGRQHEVRKWAGQKITDELTGEVMQLEKSVAKEALDNPDTTNRLARYAIRKAEQIVKDTQFAGGITNAPYALTGVPALGKMLLNFPTRFASFVTRGGMGRIGRTLLGTGAAIGIGSALLGPLGEELAKEATLTGALPLPDENNLFAPWPLVPPIAQLGGAAVQSAVTGDTSHLRRSLPLLVPGGVGLARVVGTHSETAGRFLGKSWADYSNPLPDGRLPLYNPEGALIGYYSKAQLYARSLGLGDINGAQERALTKWMLGHRDRIAQVRRDYLDARANNDQRAADRAERAYQQAYPGLGPIPVKKSHMRALHLRRDVARAERVLENMPAEVRSQFAAAISTAFAQRGPGFFGLEPGTNLMSGSTIRDRDPYRLRPPSQLMQAGSQNETQLLGESSFLDGAL